MIADLKPYPSMKDSGVEWLHMIPEHWEIRRMKTLLRERSKKDFPDKPLLAATQTKGVVRKEQYENRTVLALKDLHLLKLVRVGDFVISLRSFQGGIEYAREQGIISPAYTILYPVERDNHAYLAHVFKSEPYIENLSLFVTGIRQGQNIDYEKLSRAPFPYPPHPEQTAIVRFLDHADRRIRRYIRAKQRLITLLEEQKQAIIHQAVTGQIDVRTGKPYPAYKDSGVEWLGNVPEHWKILPLKRWISTKITDGPHETPALLDDGIPFMSAESMVGGRLDFSRRRGFISREQHEIYCRKCRPRRDDIFMCKSGATTGKVAIVETADEFSVWSPLALIRVESHKVLARLLFAVLQTRYVQRQVQDTWSYGTQPNLAMKAMERLVVVLPPIDEQQEVLAHLDRTTKKPSEAIDRAHREISLLREYRTRLIADVVTGKLDVRSAAARLPDEIKEPEPVDQADPLIDGEEEPIEAATTREAAV